MFGARRLLFLEEEVKAGLGRCEFADAEGITGLLSAGWASWREGQSGPVCKASSGTTNGFSHAREVKLAALSLAFLFPSQA